LLVVGCWLRVSGHQPDTSYLELVKQS
jgi:hypothetical protein